MSDQAVRQWLRQSFPQREADERETTLVAQRVRDAQDAFERAHTRLLELVMARAPSRFEIETQVHVMNATRQAFLFAERERDLRLQQAMLNLDEHYASVIAAMRSLPQTVPIVTQERLDRELTICLTLANPTLPTGVTPADAVFAQRSTVF